MQYKSAEAQEPLGYPPQHDSYNFPQEKIGVGVGVSVGVKIGHVQTPVVALQVGVDKQDVISDAY